MVFRHASSINSSGMTSSVISIKNYLLSKKRQQPLPRGGRAALALSLLCPCAVMVVNKCTSLDALDAQALVNSAFLDKLRFFSAAKVMVLEAHRQRLAGSSGRSMAPQGRGGAMPRLGGLVGQKMASPLLASTLLAAMNSSLFGINSL
jgi:hypothetical protein